MTQPKRRQNVVLRVIREMVERGPSTADQLAAASGCTRSVAHRMLKQIEEHGMLKRCGRAAKESRFGTGALIFDFAPTHRRVTRHVED